MKVHYPLSPLTVRRYAFLFRLTQLQTISYPVAGPTCPPTQHLPVPHCAPAPLPTEPATSASAWLMSLVTGLWPFSLPQGHLSLPPTSQSTTWIWICRLPNTASFLKSLSSDSEHASLPPPHPGNLLILYHKLKGYLPGETPCLPSILWESPKTPWTVYIL